ncbi:MAG: GspE/PulE family protein [bacterium]|nr:GspE/PulE family protein [bacterium]
MLTDAFVEETVRKTKLVPDDALTSSQATAHTQGRPLAEVLITKKLVGEQPLYDALAAALGVSFVDLHDREIPPDTLAIISVGLAMNRHIVAYETTEDGIRVAMEDPDDLDTIELLRRATGKTIIPALATSTGIMEATRAYHADVAATVQSLAELSIQPDTSLQATNGRDLHELAEEAPIVRIVEMLLQHAMSRQASDIHIEPTERGVDVRYRIDGILRSTTTLPRTVAPGLVARIKVLANLKIDEHRLPQDGRFNASTPNEHVAVRVSIMPVYDGEKVVLRILRESGKAVTVVDLGLRQQALGDAAPLAVVERNMRKPHGIIFVTGPTGSGKTTTLYAILNALNKPGVNIATIEDPIEYRIPGINQTQVQPRIGLTFATGLRSLLRQDPNVIMVGEIRDAETADIAVNAALTGHLVFATLHTNDAATSLTRLQEMGVPTFLIASTINCIIAQRLVRRLCEPCRAHGRIPEELRTELQELHGAALDDMLRRITARTGSTKHPATLTELDAWQRTTCAACVDGYRGRVGIFEVLEVSPAIAARIHARANRDEIHALAVAEGMATMFVDGMLKAVDGVTTVEEVLRVTRE